jgi:16S rRNA (cytosine1402-N4)-methyltransferase
VKNYIKAGNLEGEIKKDFYGQPESCWKMINRKVITPAEAELEENRRSRSAKLRIAEKV